MRNIKTYLCLLISLLASCQGNKEQVVLKIAVAANMNFSMTEIARSFEMEYNVKVEMSTASSGMLTSQIINGAPFDVFISANMDYPLALYSQELASLPEVYAFGKVVMAVPSGIAIAKNWQELLLSDEVKRIAIANPASAPYGIATLEALNKDGSYESLASKIILGESVAQVNQYLKIGSVDVAFTSNAFQANFKADYAYYEIPRELYQPIKQGVSIIKQKSNMHKAASELFLNYLRSETCQTILLNHGFSIND
jgi:molybdate transport system substrate-binding protein